MQVSTATTAELIAFFNANTGGNPVKKFADRKTAERRVQALIDEMVEEGVAVEPPVLDEEYTRITLTESTDAKNARVAAEQRSAPDTSGLICPHCGCNATLNGIGYDGDEVNGKVIRHTTYDLMCLGCGEEFGPELKRYVRVRGNKPVTERPEMVKSLKLDRQILSVNSGIVYKNACQVWKAGLVSSAQGDRLSATLYGEAKKGNRMMSVSINGHVFTLAVK